MSKVVSPYQVVQISLGRFAVAVVSAKQHIFNRFLVSTSTVIFTGTEEEMLDKAYDLSCEHYEAQK